MKKNNRRVVITGLGAVTSIGIGKDEFWKNCLAGKSGISKIESFDTSKFDRHYGGEIKDFKPERFIDRRKLKTMGRASQLAVAASKLAIEDAKLNRHEITSEKIGVCIGTTMAEISIIEKIDSIWIESGDKNISKRFIALAPSSAIPANVAKEFKIRGRNLLFANACAAGNYSIGFAFDLIRLGRLNFMLSGGVDAFSRTNLVGFSRLYAMASEKCQPFDKNRQGMLVGEGSGIIILESLESALARKVPIYAEVLGYGLSCDAYHMTAPAAQGVIRCMQKALKYSGVSSDDVDYISAHGTGTIPNDKTECAGIKKVFGQTNSKTPVSSIKSMLGHSMGAASAIEAIACCLAIKEGMIPPTINFETFDPECDIDCVPNKARKQKLNIVLNNSYAFGGNNASLVLRRCSDK
ncbi:beta-ketoacyl-[acyl-carrier-protein] synthase family protein [Candidatus Omnitrophota bacterium]